MKILWFDTETGGLDRFGKNPILTLAGIIEIDGQIKEEFEFKMKPFPNQFIETSALKVNGITLEEIETFEEPRICLSKLNSILGKYCNKFDKTDKYIPGGHNIQFDIDQLTAFYNLAGDKYLFSWLDYHKICTMGLSVMLKTFGWINPENVKLETIAAYYWIPLVAHNSRNDIRATREVFYKIKEKLSYAK